MQKRKLGRSNLGSSPKSVISARQAGEARAAVIDGCDEVLGRSESERAVADGFDLVVHSFDGSV